MLEQVATAGADVIGIDWHVDFGTAIHRVGAGSVVQGNLDPLSLFAPPVRIEEAAHQLVHQGHAARGHIVNVGHGLIPATPIEGVEALVRGVREAKVP